jgi:hypothetical protein
VPLSCWLCRCSFVDGAELEISPEHFEGLLSLLAGCSYLLSAGDDPGARKHQWSSLALASVRCLILLPSHGTRANPPRQLSDPANHPRIVEPYWGRGS